MRAHLFTAVGLCAGLVAATGCGGGSSYSGNPTQPSGGGSGSTINIVGSSGTQAFSPNPASFGGQNVVFKNNDGVTHHIVFNDGSADAGLIAPGGTSAALAVPSAGTHYHCAIHPGMIGSINAASGGSPPPCSGPYCTGY